MRCKKNESEDQPDRDLLNHISGLGLDSVESYRDWCAENGFSKRLNKHWKVRSRESYFASQEAANQRLRQKKLETRKPLAILEGICDGRVTETDVTQAHLKRFCAAIHNKQAPNHERQVNRAALKRLVTHLVSCRTKFLDKTPVHAGPGRQEGDTYLEAIALIASHSSSWLRTIEEWKPTTRNTQRQFASLLRHLFAKFDDLPLFFDKVWFTHRGKAAAESRRWYLHVGRGKSIRECDLPIPCTKKMAHHFMQAPADVTVSQAIRWGQVHALGGDERLTRAVFGSRLANAFDHDDFWSTVLGWFIANPMLDRAHCGPIIDYLYHQRFVPERVFIGPGQNEETAAPQPQLSMRGRTPETLLRQVNQWHGRLATSNTHQVRQWQPCGIREFEFTEGSEQGRNLKVWTVRELLGSKALVAEGRQMKHCVATYASSCVRGACSIWTMEVESFQSVTKALTLEVRNNSLTICQARGKANRLPTDKERGVLTRWAALAGLKIANYV